MDNYEFVSDLINKVLTSKITLKDALGKFPPNYFKDANLKSAFDALMHYEADEDIRKKDCEYAKLQDDYLEYIASVLNKHESLPGDVVKRYCEYHKDNLIFGNKKGLRGFIEYIKRMVNF